MNDSASNVKIPSGKPTTVTRRSTDPIGRRKKSPAPHPIEAPIRSRTVSRTPGKSCGANISSNRPRTSTETE